MTLVELNILKDECISGWALPEGVLDLSIFQSSLLTPFDAPATSEESNGKTV